MWPFKKSAPPPQLPVINAYSPTVGKDARGYECSFGIDKSNNAIYYCFTKPGDVKTVTLPTLVEVYPVKWIKKALNGGDLLAELETSRGPRIWDLRPLLTGEVYLDTGVCRHVSQPERRSFEKQGHAEFDLLACLFTGTFIFSSTGL